MCVFDRQMMCLTSTSPRWPPPGLCCLWFLIRSILLNLDKILPLTSLGPKFKKTIFFHPSMISLIMPKKIGNHFRLMWVQQLHRQPVRLECWIFKHHLNHLVDHNKTRHFIRSLIRVLIRNKCPWMDANQPSGAVYNWAENCTGWL